jgi:hypothetical protein
MKQLVASIIFFLIVVNGYAGENSKETVTCFWMMEPEGDCTGETSRYTYHDGEFWTILAGNSGNEILVSAYSSDLLSSWHLGFGISGVGSFVPGIHKIRGQYILDGTRSSFFFALSAAERLANVVFDGELEILELEYEENGFLKAFAANFIQSDNDLPIIGAIRINSSIPIKENNKRITNFLRTLPSDFYVPRKELFIEQSSLISKSKRKWYSSFLDKLPRGHIFP